MDREKAKTPFVSHLISLQELEGDWHCGEEIASRSTSFRVGQYEVECNIREVDSWDQPLISTGFPGKMALLVRNIDGELQVLGQGWYEMGSYDQMEITTSVHMVDGGIYGREINEALWKYTSSAEVKLLYQGRFSEEGGRFYLEKNTYRLVEVPSTAWPDLPSTFQWLTLKDIQRALLQPNVFTNEMRGALALLFSL